MTRAALLVVPFLPLLVVVPVMAERARSAPLPEARFSPHRGFMVPPAGTPVVLPAVDTQGRRLPSEGRALLIVAGSCLGCATELPNVASAARRMDAVTVVWAAREEVPADFRRRLAKARVSYDPRQLLLPFAFRTRTPAGYVVDLESHRLLAAQGADEGFADFVRRLR